MQMSPTPRIAKTIQAIASGTHSDVIRIQNRYIAIDEAFVDSFIQKTKVGFTNRRPRMSKANKQTDMDLFSMLVPLMKQKTVLSVAPYGNYLPTVTTVGVQHFKQDRFGELLNLVSHKELVSFGVQIRDMSIVKRNTTDETDELGAARTFMLVDYTGQQHSGYNGLSWNARENEKMFMSRYGLDKDTAHRNYKHFTHPNRWQSIYGAPHLMMKLLLQRTEDELRHCKSEMERLHSFVPQQLLASEESVTVPGNERSALVPIFTMRLRGVEFVGKYSSYEDSAVGYNEAEAQYKLLAYKVRPRVQFVVRANETAFYHNGLKQNNIARWVKGTQWRHKASTDPYEDKASFAFTSTLTLEYRATMVFKTIKEPSGPPKFPQAGAMRQPFYIKIYYENKNPLRDFCFRKTISSLLLFL